jgi:hypothetical protein
MRVARMSDSAESGCKSGKKRQKERERERSILFEGDERKGKGNKEDLVTVCAVLGSAQPSSFFSTY